MANPLGVPLSTRIISASPLEFVVSHYKDTGFDPKKFYGEFIATPVEYSLYMNAGKVFGRKHPDGSFSVIGHFTPMYFGSPSYFKPAKHLPPDRRQWRTVSRQVKENLIEVHGSLARVEVSRAVELLKQFMDWRAGAIFFSVLNVAMRLDGLEIDMYTEKYVSSGLTHVRDAEARAISKLKAGIPNMVLELESRLSKLRSVYVPAQGSGNGNVQQPAVPAVPRDGD